MADIRFLFIPAIILACVSCKEGETSTVAVPDYVTRAISNQGDEVRSFVDSFNPKDSEGGIVVIDEGPRCSMQSGIFLNQDLYDNIDGAPAPDYLSDYAGETVVSVSVPPVGVATREEAGDLAVRYALASLCGVCSDDPYDPTHRAPRTPAKVVVLGSPALAVAIDDVIALYGGLGIDVPVLSGVRSSVEYAFAKHTPVIGVIAAAGSNASAAYKSEVDRMRGRTAGGSAKVFVYEDNAEDGADLLQAFLKSYSDSGHTSPVEVLIVDSDMVDMSVLHASLELIRSVRSIENSFYMNLLSKDFEFVNAMEKVAAQCYGVMRERNVFTHNVAYPKSEFYRTDCPECVFAKSAPIIRNEYVQD